ncbi:MAG: hypothetical protein RM022_025190, partial [Nostoc sp. EfeVER01]|uniref:hypothetical protein n=1 Tax=Nostoc sp. EfeVER01 TaxID=3075406 RepID=UPI002AD4DCD2
SFRHSSNYNQQSISLAYKTLISNPPAPCPLPPAQTKQGISQNRIAPIPSLQQCGLLNYTQPSHN